MLFLYTYKYIIDYLLVKSTATAHSIIGGRHVFKLTCLPIPEGGVQRYALAETGVQ